MAALEGMGVLVTRPAGQAGGLLAALEAAGARPVPFPTLEIRGLAGDPALTQALARLPQCHLAVFVSPNAVRHGLAAAGALPPHLELLAVGPATARALREATGRPVAVPPEDARSETLLALPALAPERVSGRCVAVFRGRGGREHLAQTLRRRGARVCYLECYERCLPAADPAPVNRQGRAGEIQAVVVTSGEALENLQRLLGDGGRAWLPHTALVVVSRRLAELARDRGHRGPVLQAAGAADAAIVEALERWRAAPEPAHG